LTRLRTLLLVLAALLVALPSSAQAPGRVTAIEVQGNQRIEADTIRSYMLVQPGGTADPDALDRSLRALFATGLFRDVTIRPEGGRIIVNVVENPLVNRVGFEGNRRITTDVLRNEVQLRTRSVFTPAAAQADRQRILEIYARRGRFGATVEPKIIELDQNRVDVVFEINEGEVALVARINFVGNTDYSDSRLKEVIATREQAWYRILSTSDTYDPDRLNFDRELLRRFYLRQGYADVEITGATAELAPDRSGFFLTYTINEGPRYRIGEVNVTSTLRGLDPASVQRDIPISPGEWYDGDAVDRADNLLTDLLATRGFPFANVEPRVVRHREQRTVDLTFEITEGPRAFVERIEITGNTRTLDRVIRREFRLAEGDPLVTQQVRRSRDRIRSLGFFSDVQINSSPGSASDRVILNTQVAERATGEFTLGGGYSTDAGFLADVGLRERNLLGTGIGCPHQRDARAVPQPGRHLGDRPAVPRAQPRRRHRRLPGPARPAVYLRLTMSAAPASCCAWATRSTSVCVSRGPTRWWIASFTTSTRAPRASSRTGRLDPAEPALDHHHLRPPRQPHRTPRRLRHPRRWRSRGSRRRCLLCPPARRRPVLHPVRAHAGRPGLRPGARRRRRLAAALQWRRHAHRRPVLPRRREPARLRPGRRRPA
jgi:outer membrane translocation and assembly module TamA